jgi:carbonic anhydrase
MRRHSVTLVLAFVLCLPAVAQSAAAQPAAAPDLDGNALWKALLTGNLKYQAGEISYDKLKKERTDLVQKQEPPVIVLSCSDSRVPPELIFNQSLGSLFVVRVAGNIADEAGLASMEYAVLHDWTKLIVVLGHENCGAVGSALERGDPHTPSLLALMDRIRSSFIGIAWNGDKSGDLTAKAVRANARASAAWLTAQSHVIRDAVIDGKVIIVPAYYELGSGEVKAIE